jgi:hypothetical protein
MISHSQLLLPFLECVMLAVSDYRPPFAKHPTSIVRPAVPCCLVAIQIRESTREKSTLETLTA